MLIVYFGSGRERESRKMFIKKLLLSPVKSQVSSLNSQESSTAKYLKTIPPPPNLQNSTPVVVS